MQFRELEVVDIPDILKTLKRLFGAIIEDLTLKGKPYDLMRMAIECPTLDYPIIIPVEQIQYLTADTILAEIERVLQSNEDFVLESKAQTSNHARKYAKRRSQKTLQIRK